MQVTGLPAGLRVTQVLDEHLDAVTSAVRALETWAFGRSEGNRAEMLAAVRAPELHGTQGTAAVWDGQELLAVMLAYDEVGNAGALTADLFVHPDADHRTAIATRLLAACHAYADVQGAPEGTWLKVENFGDDIDVETALRDLGFEQHRVYVRMRLDFDSPPETPAPLAGLTVRGMQEEHWPAFHEVVNSAFRDHYDFHPLPFETFREQAIDEVSDPEQWRLVFDGQRCVAACTGSNRYAAHRLGYVDTLCVVREYRGRGIARYLLRDAFARDAALGHAGTALHCDATNPTGAAQLYESVGMRQDQRYVAWRVRFVGHGVRL